MTTLLWHHRAYIGYYTHDTGRWVPHDCILYALCSQKRKLRTNRVAMPSACRAVQHSQHFLICCANENMYMDKQFYVSDERYRKEDVYQPAQHSSSVVYNVEVCVTSHLHTLLFTPCLLPNVASSLSLLLSLKGQSAFGSFWTKLAPGICLMSGLTLTDWLSWYLFLMPEARSAKQGLKLTPSSLEERRTSSSQPPFLCQLSSSNSGAAKFDMEAVPWDGRSLDSQQKLQQTHKTFDYAPPYVGATSRVRSILLFLCKHKVEKSLKHTSLQHNLDKACLTSSTRGLRIVKKCHYTQNFALKKTNICDTLWHITCSELIVRSDSSYSTRFGPCCVGSWLLGTE